MKSLNRDRNGTELFDRIIAMNNIALAHERAKRGKAHYRGVKWVEANKWEALRDIRESLVDGSFTTSEYLIEEGMKSGKFRTIHKLPYYPDRIIQHAIILQCEPFWRSLMIRDTFQSIPSRGTKDCMDRIKKHIKDYKPTYALKIDIKKFYPSVKNKYLLDPKVLRLRCKRTLTLLKDIITSMDGIPLGNHTSQYFGNLILNDLDWYCKQDLRIRHYFRYCDDIVIMGNCKEELKLWKRKIAEKLSKIELRVKKPTNIIDLRRESLNFVGISISHNKIKLRRNVATNFKKRMRRGKSLKSIPSYYGWCKYANARKLFNKYVGGGHWWKRIAKEK